jgi:hypothetical protein
MTTPTPIATPTTLVLLDPTSDGGESALDLLDEQDRHITLVVLISGTASQALRDFADAEQVYVSDAGWRYLEQVAERLHLQPEQLAFVNASGPDAASELALVAATEEIHRVLLPSSVDRFERGLSDSIAHSVAAPVITAPLSARTG